MLINGPVHLHVQASVNAKRVMFPAQMARRLHRREREAAPSAAAASELASAHRAAALAAARSAAAAPAASGSTGAAGAALHGRQPPHPRLHSAPCQVTAAPPRAAVAIPVAGAVAASTASATAAPLPLLGGPAAAVAGTCHSTLTSPESPCRPSSCGVDVRHPQRAQGG